MKSLVPLVLLLAGALPTFAAEVETLAPTFVDVGKTYRIAFNGGDIATFKILDRAGGGWFKANVLNTVRPQVSWINLANAYSVTPLEADGNRAIIPR